MMHPYPTINENLKQCLKLLVPYAFMALLLLLNVISISHAGISLLGYPFFIIALYYWSIHRPTVLPLWLIAFIGMIMDIVTYTPIGVNVLLLGAIQILVISQRRFLMAQSFLLNWAVFSAILTAYMFMNWVLQTVLLFKVLPSKNIGQFIVISIMVFPLIMILSHITHKILPISGKQKMLKTL